MQQRIRESTDAAEREGKYGCSRGGGKSRGSSKGEKVWMQQKGRESTDAVEGRGKCGCMEVRMYQKGRKRRDVLKSGAN